MSTTKKRILYIATELSPYLEVTEYAEILNKLAVKSNDAEMEVRCIMPRFGTINERRHRLHEVVRLSGINVSVDNDDYPLQIKVASLPNARLQVYFLDNDEFFKRKALFHDEDKWFDDNDLRTIFFCKGALETVKKFGWPPDVIHCSGWMSSLVPLFLKTAYKKEPVFSHSKVIYTIGANTYEENLGADWAQHAQISNSIKSKDLEAFGNGDNTSMFRGGASYADAVVFGSDQVEPSLIDEFSKAKGKKIVTFNGWESDLTEYMNLYDELTEDLS